MSIAYLTPIYPSPSTTFIRREIAALESRGLVVHRFAMRRFAGKLVDDLDIAEQRQTYFLVEAGITALVTALFWTALTRPRRWITTLVMAVRLGLRSERGLIRHLIYLAEACSLHSNLWPVASGTCMLILLATRLTLR